MGYMVEGEYPSYAPNRGKYKASILLNADQPFNPYNWEPPIKWSGYVDGNQVQFTQTSDPGYSEKDFDFSSFPRELRESIPYIIEAIDNASRIMD